MPFAGIHIAKEKTVTNKLYTRFLHVVIGERAVISSVPVSAKLCPACTWYACMHVHPQRCMKQMHSS